MYRAIIFDFFDVIRTDPYHAWLRRNGLKRKGELQRITESVDRGDIDIPELHRRLHTMTGHPVETMQEEFGKTTVTHPGMPLFIGLLRHHYKTALMSNADSKYLRDLLSQHNYNKLFDYIFVSSEQKLIKPEARAFRQVLAHLHVTPQEAVFVDDSQRNVEAANALGITGLLFTDLPQLKKDLAGLGINF